MESKPVGCKNVGQILKVARLPGYEKMPGYFGSIYLVAPCMLVGINAACPGNLVWPPG